MPHTIKMFYFVYGMPDAGQPDTTMF